MTNKLILSFFEIEDLHARLYPLMQEKAILELKLLEDTDHTVILNQLQVNSSKIYRLVGCDLDKFYDKLDGIHTEVKSLFKRVPGLSSIKFSCKNLKCEINYHSATDIITFAKTP